MALQASSTVARVTGMAFAPFGRFERFHLPLHITVTLVSTIRQTREET
jgi:hypothetical protein